MLDPRLILAGEPVNVLGALQGGAQAAGMANDVARGNALAGIYRDQGPGILAGDSGALNALAGIDPMAAVGVRNTIADNRRADEQLSMVKEAARQKAAEWAAQQDAATVAQMAERQAAMIRGAAALHAKGDRAGYEAWLRQHGEDPATLPFDQFPAVMAGTEGALEVWTQMAPKAPADEYQRYVQEEAAAGRQPLPRLEFEQAKKGKGFQFSTPDGTTLSFGGASGQVTGDTINYNPTEVKSVLSLIDEIGADKNLPRVLGPVEGGGGNDVNQLNTAQRMWYGSGGLSVIEKIDQLQSSAWLAARQMLKGGGAITDYESRKAEAAMARLSRTKDETEFKAALQDLRQAIEEGQAKLNAARGQGAAPAAAPAPAAAGAAGMPPEFLQRPDVQAAVSEGVDPQLIWQLYQEQVNGGR